MAAPVLIVVISFYFILFYFQIKFCSLSKFNQICAKVIIIISS